MTKHPHRDDCRCSGNLPLDRNDPWWISAPEYGNCFWTYIRYNDHEHTLSEIAKLMKLSISAITSIERKAFAKVRKGSEYVETSGE